MAKNDKLKVALSLCICVCVCVFRATAFAEPLLRRAACKLKHDNAFIVLRLIDGRLTFGDTSRESCAAHELLGCRRRRLVAFVDKRAVRARCSPESRRVNWHLCCELRVRYRPKVGLTDFGGG